MSKSTRSNIEACTKGGMCLMAFQDNSISYSRHTILQVTAPFALGNPHNVPDELNQSRAYWCICSLAPSLNTSHFFYNGRMVGLCIYFSDIENHRLSTHIRIFSRITLKHGRDNCYRNMSNEIVYGGSVSLNMRIVDHLMKWSIVTFLGYFSSWGHHLWYKCRARHVVQQTTNAAR